MLEEELWPETREEAWAREEKRRELFNDAKDWPLVSAVTSAVYKISGDETERFGFVGNFTWSEILWILLVFKEQVFDMVESKGWGNLCRKTILTFLGRFTNRGRLVNLPQKCMKDLNVDLAGTQKI